MDKKDFDRLLQAIAVKQNLNTLKEFAYSKGYKNQVTEFKNAILAEIREGGLKNGEAIKYLTTQYMGGKTLGTRKATSTDDIFTKD
jgi:hypothetical protein